MHNEPFARRARPMTSRNDVPMTRHTKLASYHVLIALSTSGCCLARAPGRRNRDLRVFFFLANAAWALMAAR
jgi:hypothetical protein